MVLFQEKEDLSPLFEFIAEMLEAGEIWFGFNGTESWFNRNWPK